jgi:aryl-alcohol dehydrogenase-like predicted oxidoreductase
MGVSWEYGPGEDRLAMISLLRKVFDLGVTLFDTAEVYGRYKNEELVVEAFSSVRDEAVIATKCGYECDPNGAPHPIGVNGKPDHMRQVADASLKRLKTDGIDLFYQHRVDPQVPIEGVAGIVLELMESGKVRHCGLSEASFETIRRAHGVQPVAAVAENRTLITYLS